MNRTSSPDPLRAAGSLHARAVEEYAAARPARSRLTGRRALAELDAAELDAAELDAAGLDAAGLDAAGLDAAELDATAPAQAGAAPAADGRVLLRDRLRVRVLLSLALAESDVAGPDAARPVLDEAAVLAGRIADRLLTVLVHSQRGALALREHDLVTAIREYGLALPDSDVAPAFNQWVLVGNLSVAHLFAGDLPEARSFALRAVDIARNAGLAREEAKSRHNLGYLEFLAGDLPRALHQMAEARAVSPDLPDGVGLLDRARVLVEAGLLREADALLADATEIFRRDRAAQDLGEVELERATAALLAGDVPTARRFAAAARTRFRKRGADRWRRSAELVLLEGDLAAGRPGRRLSGPAMRLQEEFTAAGATRLARAAGLIAAQAHLAAGDVGAAGMVVAALPAAARSDPVTARLQEHYMRAQLDAATGQRAAATRRISGGLADLARYQASFGSIDLASAAAVHGRRLAAYGIELARAGGRPAEVFAAAERARAVTSRLRPVRPPADPVTADLLAELRQTVESLRPVEQDRTAAAPLLAKRRELERAIIARGWGAAGSGAVGRPATLRDVGHHLTAQGRTMISFVQADGKLSAVTVGSGLRLHDLGPSAPVVEHVRRTRADLDVLAQPRLPGGIRAAVRASLDRCLRELDRCLLGSLDVAGPLVIVSTGALGQLPWASLPSLRGRSLVVAPSASKWLASATGPSAGTGQVVAICGPDLSRGATEAHTVAAMWPDARSVVGDSATTAAFVGAIGSARVLHVAAHGVHQSQNPLFSFVRMVDGPVFAHDLDRIAHAPEHVVLSACEVGAATVRPGDEALGLASALLQLGTRSVIAGVARVGDGVAEQTMIAYHRRLAAGLDSSAALAEALCEVDTDLVAPFVNFGASWQRQ